MPRLLKDTDPITGKPRFIIEGDIRGEYKVVNGKLAKKTPADFAEDEKPKKIEELKAAYQHALEAGVLYQGARFDSDEHSQTEIARVLVALANGWALPAGFAWVDAANNLHPVPNIAWLQGLADAMANHKAALFARLQKAKAAVRAASTPAQVKAVVF